MQNARTVLDVDHYGLEKVKDRIIEHRATFTLKRQARQEYVAAQPEPTTTAG